MNEPMKRRRGMVVFYLAEVCNLEQDSRD